MLSMGGKIFGWPYSSTPANTKQAKMSGYQNGVGGDSYKNANYK